jgi:hypothetical protein
MDHVWGSVGLAAPECNIVVGDERPNTVPFAGAKGRAMCRRPPPGGAIPEESTHSGGRATQQRRAPRREPGVLVTRNTSTVLHR